jgi:biopolymer transport protein ExbB/TolQ
MNTKRDVFSYLFFIFLAVFVFSVSRISYVIAQQEGVTQSPGTVTQVQEGATSSATTAVGKEEAPPSGQEGEKKEEKGIIGKLIEAYKVGDWPMHLILLMFLVIIALSVERGIAVWFVYGKDPAKTFEEVKAAFEEGGLKRALEVAEQNSKLPIGAVLYSALRVLEKSNLSELDEKEIKELITSAVEEEYLRFIPKIQNRVPLIHIFANTAVLLGLLGAVIGLIEAFAGVGGLDPAQRQIYLSKSISIVMHSTAFGLIVAISGVVFFAVISSRANNLVSTLEEYSVRAANWVSLMAIDSARKSNKEKSK